MRFITLFIFLTAVLSNGCVTVKIGGSESKRAEDVKYSAPPDPFQAEERTDVDAAWKNKKNGNVISFLSDCKDPSDPPLDQIVSGVMSGLSEIKYESEDSPLVQEREGRRVLASGKVDGVPTQIDLLVFKRNHCIYVLSYVGVKKAFAADREHFNRFVQGFKAP